MIKALNAPVDISDATVTVASLSPLLDAVAQLRTSHPMLTGQWGATHGRNPSEAAGQGLEPRLPDPESGVLPLDDPAARAYFSRTRRDRLAAAPPRRRLLAARRLA